MPPPNLRERQVRRRAFALCDPRFNPFGKQQWESSIGLGTLCPTQYTHYQIESLVIIDSLVLLQYEDDFGGIWSGNV
jgi:hypothetical protein